MTKDELLSKLIENGKNLGNLNRKTEVEIDDLLLVIRNQANEAMEHLELSGSEEAEERVLPFLYQIETLVKVIRERINPNEFIAADNIAFNICEYEKAQA